MEGKRRRDGGMGEKEGGGKGEQGGRKMHAWSGSQ
jgi:hypothetical protein